MKDFCLSCKWEMVVKYEIEYILEENNSRFKYKLPESSRWDATYIREDSYLN